MGIVVGAAWLDIGHASLNGLVPPAVGDIWIEVAGLCLARYKRIPAHLWKVQLAQLHRIWGSL